MSKRHRAAKCIVMLLLFAVLAAGLLTGCAFQRDRKNTCTTVDYLDTVCTLTAYEDSERFVAASYIFLSELERYDRLFDIYTRYEGLNNLYALNRAEGEPMTVDRDIFDLLSDGLKAYEMTDGQVNICMGSVLSVWHRYMEQGYGVPTDEELSSAAGHVSPENLLLDPETLTVRMTDPDMRIDVGAVAKGWIADRLAGTLEAAGFENFAINLGGNIALRGRKDDGTLWHIGIESPDGTGDFVNLIALDGEDAISTSGSYQRYYDWEGGRYHHIIDPDTLWPADTFVSVSVVSRSACLSDCLSTALFNMSEQQGRELIRQLEETVQVMWIYRDGTCVKTEGWPVWDQQKTR